jgi:chromosomal replication initiator protein
LATEVMDVMYPVNGSIPGSISIKEIQLAVARHYALTVEELVSPSRTARIAGPRQVAIHLTRDLSSASLQVIGQAFGGRNHATVLHACKRVSDRMRNDQQAAQEISEIAKQLRSRQADRDY